MKKLEFTMEHFDYGMQKRLAGELVKDGEDVEAKRLELIHDGAVVSVEVKVPKKVEKKEPKKVEKAVKKAAKKVVKEVKKKVSKKKKK